MEASLMSSMSMSQTSLSTSGSLGSLPMTASQATLPTFTSQASIAEGADVANNTTTSSPPETLGAEIPSEKSGEIASETSLDKPPAQEKEQSDTKSDTKSETSDKPEKPTKSDKSLKSARSKSAFFSNSTANLPTAESVSISGYLKKQGRKMKFFTRYYFTFDPSLKTLSYFPNAKSKKPKTIMHIGRYSIEDLGNATEKGPYMFKISTPSKSIVLGAETQEDKENWVSHMRARIPTTASASIFREQSTLMRGALSPSPSSPPGSPSSSMASIPPLSPPMSPPLSPVYRHISLDESEPVAHNTVPRVTIEGRYIFTTPKPKQLERKAKRLNKALAERFPNQTNVIVYDFDFSKSRRGFRLFRLGTLDVYRSLDATTPHFVTAPLVNDADAHSSEVINSPMTMYALLKALPFLRKLQLFDTEIIERPPAEKVYIIFFYFLFWFLFFPYLVCFYSLFFVTKFDVGYCIIKQSKSGWTDDGSHFVRCC